MKLVLKIEELQCLTGEGKSGIERLAKSGLNCVNNHIKYHFLGPEQNRTLHTDLAGRLVFNSNKFH